MSCIAIYNKLQEIVQYDTETWIEGSVLSIGRSELTQLPLPDMNFLSGHHLSIRKLGGEFYIRDEQSSNGTFVNGTRMSHSLRMHPDLSYQSGDLIIYLEDFQTAPADNSNCDSVFPEEHRFALLATAPTQEYIAAPTYEDSYQEAPHAPMASAYEDNNYGNEVEQSYQEAPHAHQTPAAPVVALAPGSIRPLVSVAQAPKSGIPTNFQLEVELANELPVIAGDKLRFRIRAQYSCHLTIVCQDEQGETHTIYPNALHRPTPIPADEWIELPSRDNADYEFIVEGENCIDHYQILARYIPEKLVARRNAEGAVKDSAGAAADKTAKVSRKIKAQPAKKRTSKAKNQSVQGKQDAKSIAIKQRKSKSKAKKLPVIWSYALVDVPIA